MEDSKVNNINQNRSLSILYQTILELYNRIVRLSRKIYKQYKNNRPHNKAASPSSLKQSSSNSPLKKAILLSKPYHQTKHPSSKNLKKQSVMPSGTAPSDQSQVGQSPQVMH
jgi:hypothetical protein